MKMQRTPDDGEGQVEEGEEGEGKVIQVSSVVFFSVEYRDDSQ